MTLSLLPLTPQEMTEIQIIDGQFNGDRQYRRCVSVGAATPSQGQHGCCLSQHKKKNLVSSSSLPLRSPSTCPPPPFTSPGCQPPVSDEIRLHMEPRASSAAYTKTTTSLCEWRWRHFDVSVFGGGGIVRGCRRRECRRGGLGE